jgi:putative aldouronate transport system substrate-binding protein
LEAPKTIDDWYNTLKTFRDQKGASIPFGIDLNRLGFITSAWGFNMTNLGVEDGKIIYPPIEPEFKEALETLRKWNDEGLLILDPEELNKEIVAGTCGAWQAGPASYVEDGKATDPNFEAVAVQNPVVNEGDTSVIFPRWPFEGRGAAVSAQCPEEKYEAIGRWLDYSYGEEGYLLDNFGIEGEQYTVVDDKIMPVDIMYEEQPDGLTLEQYKMRHFRPRNAPGPYMTCNNQHYLHEDALKKDANYPYKAQSVEAWGNGDPSRTLPLLYLTAEETEKVNNYSVMQTYVDDMITKFINGEESLDNFDKFVEETKRLGASEVVTIYQAALDRYYAR